MFYLALPVFMSLCIGILLRSLWVSMKDDGQMHVIFDENPILYGVIPGIAFSSVLLVVFVVRTRCRLLEEEAEKCSLLVYQNRVEDLEGYIRDLEGMQERIQGMISMPCSPWGQDRPEQGRMRSILGTAKNKCRLFLEIRS